MLNDDAKKTCARACAHYGRDAQIAKCAEELRELAVELEDHLDGMGDLDRINEERADVAIMLYQLDTLLGLVDMRQVQDVIDKKITRLNLRIDCEKKER